MKESARDKKNVNHHPKLRCVTAYFLDTPLLLLQCNTQYKVIFSSKYPRQWHSWLYRI